MHIEIPHKSSPSKAAGRIRSALNENRAKLMQHAKIKREEWKGNDLHFEIELQGKTIPGTLRVNENDYVLDATLPLLWRMFEGKIEKEIKKQMEAGGF
jgi:hypothetical protein